MWQTECNRSEITHLKRMYSPFEASVQHCHILHSSRNDDPIIVNLGGSLPGRHGDNHHRRRRLLIDHGQARSNSVITVARRRGDPLLSHLLLFNGIAQQKADRVNRRSHNSPCGPWPHGDPAGDVLWMFSISGTAFWIPARNVMSSSSYESAGNSDL